MSNTKTHDLKILPDFFKAVASGDKPFEIRYDDRGYRCGDILHLREWSKRTGYTGREIKKQVTYLLGGAGLGLERDYVILGLSRDNVGDAMLKEQP